MNYRFAPHPPPRARFSPIIVLLLLALVPAAIFAGVWRWAAARVPKAVAPATTVVEIDPATGAPVTTVPPAAPAGLTTPILSVRRAPQTLSGLSNLAAFDAALQSVGAYVNDTSCLSVSLNGQPILDLRGDLAVTPASNQKLLVAAVALDAMGPDHTFTTTVKGTVADGVVTGDLYLVGGGDPLLSTAAYPATQEYPPSNTTSLEALVQAMVNAGVTKVQGTVVGDESRYDAERYVPTWGQGIADYEAGPLSALLVDDGAKKIGDPHPARYTDPAAGAATTFITMLKAAGIKVGGGTGTNGVAPPEAVEIASVQSAPLSDIVGEMLTTSDDNTAELLVKEIGVHFQLGGNRLSGLDAIKKSLLTWGIDTERLVMIDGSGLDSSNTVTCDIVMGVLMHQPLTGALGTGLPVAGQTGTLAAQFVGSTVVGRLHAKTGTLNSAKALSGFVTTPGGEIEFSLILNGPGVGAADNTYYLGVWSLLGSALGAYPSGATVDVLQPR